MMMEVELDLMDVDSETPPSSPIIGSGPKSRGSLGSGRKMDFEIEQFGCCFVCKGPSRSAVEELSAEGLLRNGEINGATSLLSLTSAAEGFLRNDIQEDSKFEKFEGKFFGFPFANDEETLKIFIKMCRKQMVSIEILVDQQNSSASLRHRSDESSVFDDDPSKNLAWELRKDVCVFLNAMAKGLPLVACFEAVKPMELFKGLMESVEPINQNLRLRSYSGCSDGNRSASALDHYFHLHLEIRWHSVILSLLNPTVVETVLVDLIQLAWYRFRQHERMSDLLKQTAFSCCCVKELWVMLLHLIDKYKPAGWDLWDAIKTALSTCDKIKDSITFQVWLILQIAPLYRFDSTGQYIEKLERTPNCYPYIMDLLKTEGIEQTTVDSVLRLATKLISLWGPDERLAKAVWEHWQAKVDKPVSGIQEHCYWKSCEKWLALLSSFSNDETTETSSSFNIFLKFFSTMVQNYTDSKRIQRLITPIFVKMSSNKIGSFSEIGVIRLMTFYLAISSSQDVQSVQGTVSRWFTITQELFELYKSKGRWNLVHTIIVAQSSVLLILLRRGVNISSLSEPYMKQIATLITSGSDLQAPGQKEAVMAYIEMLSLIPIYSKEDLSQEAIFSPHISMWCAKCSADCLSRTLRVLEALLTWQNNCASVPNLGRMVYSTTRDFISSVLTASQITFTSSDTNTIAQLGTSLCVYANQQHKDQLRPIFTLFALGEKTNPEISKEYVDQMLQLKTPISIDYRDASQAWIRLLACEILPPYNMTTFIFSDNTQTLSENCRDLVSIYCDLVNKEGWSLQTMTEVLQPFTKTCDRLHTLTSLALLRHRIHISLIILQRMNPPTIYGVQVPCPAKFMINGILLMASHMNQQTSPILQSALPQLFQAVQRLSNAFNDEYLKARLGQILTIAAANFVTNSHLSIPENHPLFKIVTTAYAAGDTITLRILGDLQKLSNAEGKRYSDYLKTLHQLGNHSRFAPGLIYSIPMVLKILRESGSNSDTSLCASILSHIFQMDNICPDFVEEIKRGLDIEMYDRMALHWRKYMPLFNNVIKRSGPTSLTIKRNVREIVLEKLQNYVHYAEAGRGCGANETLRAELLRFQTALNGD